MECVEDKALTGAAADGLGGRPGVARKSPSGPRQARRAGCLDCGSPALVRRGRCLECARVNERALKLSWYRRKMEDPAFRQRRCQLSMEYYNRHKPVVLERKRERLASDPEKFRAQRSLYYARHQEAERQRQRRYYYHSKGRPVPRKKREYNRGDEFRPQAIREAGVALLAARELMQELQGD